MLLCVQFFITLVGTHNFILLYCFGDGLIFHSSMLLYSRIHVYLKGQGFLPFYSPQYTHFSRLKNHISGTIPCEISCDCQTSAQSWAATWFLLKARKSMLIFIAFVMWCCGCPQDWMIQGSPSTMMVCVIPGSIRVIGYANWLKAGSSGAWMPGSPEVGIRGESDLSARLETSQRKWVQEQRELGTA